MCNAGHKCEEDKHFRFSLIDTFMLHQEGGGNFELNDGKVCLWLYRVHSFVARTVVERSPSSSDRVFFVVVPKGLEIPLCRVSNIAT